MCDALENKLHGIITIEAKEIFPENSYHDDTFNVSLAATKLHLNMIQNPKHTINSLTATLHGAYLMGPWHTQHNTSHEPVHDQTHTQKPCSKATFKAENYYFLGSRDSLRLQSSNKILNASKTSTFDTQLKSTNKEYIVTNK
jgi:hypothetical protein